MGSDPKVDSELQEFLMLEKQKAQVNAQVIFIKNYNKTFKITTFFFLFFRFTNLMKSAGTNVLTNLDQSSTTKPRLV